MAVGVDHSILLMLFYHAAPFQTDEYRVHFQKGDHEVPPAHVPDDRPFSPLAAADRP
ncbi:hypothetical protein D3C86_2245810 [compost metagenome]